ncbi:MAG: hypothetical protein JSV35_02085 [Candidatus Bathyarchaeota archaeon]|nr:MAG: hypothetical protein JSV35_02085 [Candidatus Bathyarchaeota archaeon]
MYFVFLRRVTPEPEAESQRETLAKTVTPSLPQAEIAEAVDQPEAETREKEKPEHKEEKAEVIQERPQKPTKVNTKRPKEGLFKRAFKTKPSTGSDTKSYKGDMPFCPKYLGYLGTLPKGSPYPDQCLGCRKVVSCIGLKRGEAIESIYLESEATH